MSKARWSVKAKVIRNMLVAAELRGDYQAALRYKRMLAAERGEL